MTHKNHKNDTHRRETTALMTPEGAVSIHQCASSTDETVSSVHGRQPQETRVQMARCCARLDLATEANCSGLGRAECLIHALW